MRICQLCPEGDNEIPPGTEFDHIRLMHSEILEAAREQISEALPGFRTGTPFEAIRHMLGLIEQHHEHVEAELVGLTAMAETRAGFYEKQGYRYRAMLAFCDWLVEQIDAGNPLDPQHVRAQAKRVRHAWPTVTEEKGDPE